LCRLDRFCPDHRAGARPVLHNERFAETLAQARREDARQKVGARTGPGRYDEGDVALWPGLSCGLWDSRYPEDAYRYRDSGQLRQARP